MAEQAFQLALAERYALQQIGQPRPAFAGRDPVEQLLHRVAPCLDLFEPAEQFAFDHRLLRVPPQLGQPIDQLRQAQPGPVGLLKPVKLIEADAEYRSAHAGAKTHPHQPDLPGQLQAGAGQLRARDQRPRPAWRAIETQRIGEVEDHAAAAVRVQHLLVVSLRAVAFHPPETLHVRRQRRTWRACDETLQAGQAGVEGLGHDGPFGRCRKSTIAQHGGCVALVAHSNRGVTTMRMNYQAAAPDVMTAMIGLETYLARQSRREDGVDKPLMELVKIRVSQINGCAYCLDMHTKDARALGETEQRIYALSAWRETPFFTDRERAALAWAEANTLLPQGVSRQLFEEVREYFSEAQLANLTLAIATINAWNRFGVSFAPVPGSYQPD